MDETGERMGKQVGKQARVSSQARVTRGCYARRDEKQREKGRTLHFPTGAAFSDGIGMLMCSYLQSERFTGSR